MTRLLFSFLALAVFLAIITILINFQNTKNFSPAKYIEIAQSYDYEIKRDEYGVPHIIGITDMDAAFGFGYAQTEDDYDNIEFAIKMARGTLSDFDFSLESISTLYSLVTGRGDILSNLSAIKGVELDFLIKFMNVEEIVAENKESIDQNIIDYLKGYADGINYWAATNPNKVDQSIFPVSENDLLVGMVFRMPLFYGFDHYIEELIDLLTAEDKSEIASNLLSHQPLVASIKSHFNPSGSNAFAVSKKRSANNETLLVINSHQPLTGPVAWYEAHIKSDEGLNIMGGTFPGSPFIHVGFNEFLGWGATVNQPDLGDIYELVINPENQNQYLLDGEWLDLEVVKQNFKVKLFGPFSINYPLDMYFSKHGPVLKDGMKAYALRYVGMEDINQVTEWYRLNKARNFEEWTAALRMQEIASLNLIYADKEDNIYFVHNVKSPIRNENFDWSKVLPGDQSDLIWKDFHSFDSIPQIKNPNSGYLFSTNQNPFFVTEREDNLSPDQYKETFGFQTRTTNRAYRAYELFTLDNDITYEEISLIKHDNKFSYNSRQYEFMKKIFNADFSENEKLHDAQKFLKEWNLGTDFENEHAAFGVCILSPEWLAEIKREPQPDPIKIFTDCVDEMYQNFNSLSVPWKEINFLDRGNKMIPIQGGPDVLRAIYAPRSDDGILKAVAGDGLYIYVVWDGNKNQISESIHQYGSATIDRSSSHYDDQMQLYADEKLKNTFFDNY